MNKEITLFSLSKEKVSPVLYGYVCWIIKEAQKRNIHILYFLARDGYVLKKIAETICDKKNIKIECRYLYCSRTSLRMPTYHFIGEEAYDLIFLNGYHVTLKSFFERVNLPPKSWDQVLEQANISDEISLTKELSDLEIKQYRKAITSSSVFVEFLMESSKKSYSSTIKYLRQEKLLKQNTLAIVDSGWTGSMQRSLRQILEFSGWKGNILGFYFGMFALPKKEDGEYLTFYFGKHYGKKNKVLFCNNLFECFLSAPHGMTIGYEENSTTRMIEPIFAEKLNKTQLCQIEEQQRGILNGVNKCINLNISFSSMDCQKILRKLMGHPKVEIVKIYSQFLFCDDITEKYHCSLIGSEDITDLLIGKKILKKIRNKNLAKVFWEYGAVALIRNPIKRLWYWLNVYIWKNITYSI